MLLFCHSERSAALLSFPLDHDGADLVRRAIPRDYDRGAIARAHPHVDSASIKWALRKANREKRSSRLDLLGSIFSARPFLGSPFSLPLWALATYVASLHI
jgi:hypothetical protein